MIRRATGALRLVAPAGAPVPVTAVLRAVAGARSRPADDVVRDRLGVRHAFFLSSGRAALAVLLRVLQRESTRREVVIPAYTCFSVPSAIARAGLTIRLCDVDPKTLDLDLNALARIDLGRTLAIVPSSLYGLPGDLAGLEAIARASGTTLIDDAAQCLGATQGARPCGTFGEAGFFSLGRGKGVTTMGGGILVTQHDRLAGALERELRALRRPATHEVVTAVAGSLLYAALLAPSRYWLVDRIPFLELGGSRFQPAFTIARLSRYQQRLAAELLSRAEAYNAIRRRHAEQLRTAVDGIEGVEIPRPVATAQPVYQRFPLLTRDTAHRATLLARLRTAGIVASASYPTAVHDIPGIRRHLAPAPDPCPGARSIAARILTLPTHPGVTPGDVARMAAVMRGDA
jgi:dTDP-4-amino-4,6-dideoxygalactose transaminase